MREELYLRPDVMMEPLIDRWYAWAHLISPATYAMNLVGRHLRMMESYVSSPEVHAAAVGNPQMAGGPFVDYKGRRVNEVKALIEKTKTERAHLIAFHQAIVDLQRIIQTEASGSSLQPLYPAVPEILRGYVELVYDLFDQPSFRLIEPLLYRSPFYVPEAQSIVLSLIAGDDRPFLLSTPRLPADGELHLQIPFRHPNIDTLFSSRRNPKPLSSLVDALDLDAGVSGAVSNFLTSQAPPPYAPYEGKGVRWRYFGHACILIETSTTSILLDPCLSYTYESEISRFTYLDLPPSIDYVLITHNHQDHIMFETLLQIRHAVKHIVVPRSGGAGIQDTSLKLLLNAIGFENVIELGELDEIKTLSGSIVGLPFLGEHCDLNIQTKLAYRVVIDRHRLLFAADSCNVEPHLYQLIHGLFGDTDVLFLGMECDGAPMSWIYGALRTKPLERKKDQTRRLAGSNYAQGIEIVNRLRCREVYVYAMGQEPWLNFVMSLKYTENSNPIIQSNQLIEDCRARGIVAERLFGEKEILLD
jgi:L-ascorbate metabolism protein UlaG (beta-lactamase superfamily)